MALLTAVPVSPDLRKVTWALFSVWKASSTSVEISKESWVMTEIWRAPPGIGAGISVTSAGIVPSNGGVGVPVVSGAQAARSRVSIQAASRGHTIPDRVLNIVSLL